MSQIATRSRAARTIIAFCFASRERRVKHGGAELDRVSQCTHTECGMGDELEELAKGFRKRTWVTAKLATKMGLSAARRQLRGRDAEAPSAAEIAPAAMGTQRGALQASGEGPLARALRGRGARPVLRRGAARGPAPTSTIRALIERAHAQRIAPS